MRRKSLKYTWRWLIIDNHKNNFDQKEGRDIIIFVKMDGQHGQRVLVITVTTDRYVPPDQFEPVPIPYPGSWLDFSRIQSVVTGAFGENVMCMQKNKCEPSQIEATLRMHKPTHLFVYCHFVQHNADWYAVFQKTGSPTHWGTLVSPAQLFVNVRKHNRTFPNNTIQNVFLFGPNAAAFGAQVNDATRGGVQIHCADGNDPDVLGAMCVNALNREI